jgi:hypothetical protein
MTFAGKETFPILPPFWRYCSAKQSDAGLFVYLEFGTALPRSGGEKVYVGPPPSWNLYRLLLV